MVTTNWREMEAGRELDKEIARRVIGVPVTFDDYGGDEGILIYRDGIDDRHGICYDELAHYSTDLNAAITLANGIVEFNLFKGRKVDTEGSPTDGWICTISDPKNFDSAWADTPALAICRAFLASKEAQL